MKRSMKNIVGILLIAAMVLAFAGCGNSKASDKEQFVGSWKATLDLTDVLNESLKEGIAQADADMADYFTVDRFGFDVIFTFNDDDTYSSKIDEATLEKSTAAMKAGLKDGLTSYFEDMVAEMGLDMSVDKLLDASGFSLDELLDEALPADLFDEVLDEFRLSGKWKAKDGKLYTTESVNDDIDDSGYELYEITSAGIKLSLVDDSEDEAGVFPMLLTKIN